MYKVDVYLRVRRAVMVEGMSIREAARVFGLHRHTVRKMLAYSVPPGYRRETPPKKPKLEPYTGVIDRILEDDLRLPKKGNQWHFGMKAHIGVDSETGIVHSLSTTAANAHDVTEAHGLLHGGETQVWCDAGYQGVHKRDENLWRGVEWQVAMRPGKRRKLDPESAEALVERSKASVRAKVEHPFLKVKRVFGYAKVRYRGLAKNTDRLALLFGLGNLLTAEGQLTG